MTCTRLAPIFHLRLACPDDVPTLLSLIEASVRGLQAGDYTPDQIEASLRTLYGVDSRLIEDRTYFVVKTMPTPRIVGCGGWSQRRTLFGGDQWTARRDDPLDPATDAAKIRAFFVHPDWARRGIGGLILDACEAAARSAGFSRLEMGATLTGVPFYLSRGYRAAEDVEVPVGGGRSLKIVRMTKAL